MSRNLVIYRRQTAWTVWAQDRRRARLGRVPDRVNLAAWYKADVGVTCDAARNVSAWADQSGRGRDLLQATGAAQPLLSRADNKGNTLLRSDAFNITWTRIALNAFGATDTGALNAGSFANTARTYDPWGGHEADFLQEDSALSAHGVQQSPVTFHPVGDFSFSLYVKHAGRDFLYILLFDQGNAANYAGQYFNISTKAVAGTVVGGTGSVVQSLVEDVGNGWVRCTLTCRFTGGTGPGFLAYYRMAAANYGISYQGDGTSGMFVYGAQLCPASSPAELLPTTSFYELPGQSGRPVVWFNGTSHCLKTGAFALKQPTTLYAVLKQSGWVEGDRVWDGDGIGSGALYQSGALGQLFMRAGTALGPIEADLGAFQVVTSVFNGAQSLLQLGGANPVIGEAGSYALDGFTLGATGGATAFANCQVGEVLLYAQAHDAQRRAQVQAYLAQKWGVTL